MEGGKFDLDKMKKYINNIEAQMGHTNPAGLQLIAEELEPAPVSKLKEVLLDVLDGYDERNALTWNSSAGDQAMLASLKDIVERMAQLTKQNVAWRPARAGQPLPWEVKDPKEQKAALSVRSAAPASGLATFIIGDPAFYCAARVLGAEIERRLDRPVDVGGDSDSAHVVLRAGSVIALLTKNLLTTPSCVVELFSALNAGVSLSPVLLDGGGYNFEETRARLAGDVETWLQHGLHDGFSEILHEMVGKAVDLSDVKNLLYASITSIIAITWVPHASPNQFAATLNDICSRVPKFAEIQRSSSFKRMTKTCSTTSKVPVAGASGASSV